MDSAVSENVTSQPLLVGGRPPGVSPPIFWYKFFFLSVRFKPEFGHVKFSESSIVSLVFLLSGFPYIILTWPYVKILSVFWGSRIEVLFLLCTKKPPLQIIWRQNLMELGIGIRCFKTVSDKTRYTVI